MPTFLPLMTLATVVSRPEGPGFFIPVPLRSSASIVVYVVVVNQRQYVRQPDVVLSFWVHHDELEMSIWR